MTTTQAAVLLGPRSIETRQFPVPGAPPPGGALLKVLNSGVCGSDYDIYIGRLGGHTHGIFPVIPGHEIVGEIVAIDAAAVDAWALKQGDRVAVEGSVSCGVCSACVRGHRGRCPRRFNYSRRKLDVDHGLWGGMSEYTVLVTGTCLYKLDDSMTDADAGLINGLSNAFHVAERSGGVRRGDTVLILGAGQRGLFLSLVAREAGAKHVILTGLSRDRAKLAIGRRFGATHTVNVEEPTWWTRSTTSRETRASTSPSTPFPARLARH